MNNILIADKKISPVLLQELCKQWFGDMVKIVVDVEREIVAIGGELHADAETLLIESGSDQAYLWGANLYPWNSSDSRIEFTALINIRPHQDNPALEILDKQIRDRVKLIIEKLILRPDEELVQGT